VPGVGEELPVAWVIDGFHPHNRLHQLRIMVVDMLDEFGLGIGWPGDEDSTGICDGLSDCVQEILILRGVPRSRSVRGFVVNVPGGMVRMQYQLFGCGRAEMKYTRFAMIDPDDRVKVMSAHTEDPFATQRRRCCLWLISPIGNGEATT
jgi:hypothetical protein